MDWLYRKEGQDDRPRDKGGYPDPPRRPIAGDRREAPVRHDGDPRPRQPYAGQQSHGGSGQGFDQGQQPGYSQQQPGYGQPPADPPRPAKQRRRRRRHPVRNLFLTVLVLWLVFMIGTPIYAWSRIETVSTGLSSLENQGGTAVLLVGNDGRGNLSEEDRKRLGTGSTDGNRTDTMMLLYKPPSGKSVLLGFPRDSYVEIPGKGKNKLNAAYAFGGPELLVRTIEHNTDIHIDGYLEIGMLGLADMVDAVGGVEVCPESPMKDKDAHIDIPAGCQTLDGVTALGYVRMRKSDPKGDLGRMERQREVIGKIVKGAMSPMSFVNPVRYWNLNMAASQTLARSDETGISTAFNAGMGLIGGFTGSGISMTVPISNPDAKTKAGSAVLWDEEASKAVFRAIASGNTAELEKYHR